MHNNLRTAVCILNGTLAQSARIDCATKVSESASENRGKLVFILGVFVEVPANIGIVRQGNGRGVCSRDTVKKYPILSPHIELVFDKVWLAVDEPPIRWEKGHSLKPRFARNIC